MTRIITIGLVLLLLVGCHLPLRTESSVKMEGQVQGAVHADVDAQVKLDGKMDARVRTEMAPVVDVGPLLEMPVPPIAQTYTCKVAVIEVDGVLANLNNVGPFSIGENPVATFKEKLDAAAADPNVKAVVLRINTPGGGVAATDLMWHELIRFRTATRKPVVACLLDLGAGGGYFLATGCDLIYAIPTSVVGGVGVLLNLYDGKDSQNQTNIFFEPIRAGGKIDMGTLTRTLSDPEKAILEGMAKNYHDRFIQVVTRARPRIKANSELFDGRVMASEQGVQVGLIDEVGYLDNAIATACKLAQIDSAQPVMYRRQGDAARSLYAISPNRPIHTSLLPMSVVGFDRSKLPMFLYMWQPEPTMLRLAGN